MKRQLLLLLIATSALSLVSCSSMQRAVSKVSTPMQSAMRKVSTPVQSAMRKVSTPVKSSFAKLKTKRLTWPRFRRKTPPIIAVQEVAPIEAKKTVTKKSKSARARARARADALAWKRKKAASKKKKQKKKQNKALLPKDFDPSDLEVSGQLDSYGILPSLNPGESTPIEDLDEKSSLPADVANLPSILGPPHTPPSSSGPTRQGKVDLSPLPDFLKPTGPIPKLQSEE